jgi:hypothetical protein
MNGGADSTEQPVPATGRHRQGVARGWTPRVMPHPPGGRHSFSPALVDQPFRGSLPLLSPVSGRGSTSGYLSSSGELPLAEPACATPPPRTKVSLAPAPGHESTNDDDVGVYVAPPETGLSTFDLGSVPASVTPPRSWRKAAWFATASSGGVVVALLFAGATLVGKPAPDQAGAAWIPGLGGGLPTAEGEQRVPGPLGSPASPNPHSSSRSANQFGAGEPTGQGADTVAGPDGTTSVATSGAPAVAPTAGRPGAPSTPAGSPAVPEKPPAGPAPYDADPFQLSLQQGDPATLAENSQKYLDTVTENPEAAHEMTTGKLKREGPRGIKEKYSDVAYFEVDHIQVHQYDGKTVCTVKAVHKNGRQTTEQRTLTFQGNKIASDGN